MIISLTLSSFIKSGINSIKLFPYYISYLESSHKLYYQTALSQFKQQNKKKKKEGAKLPKKHSYANRNKLKDSSRFNLAFLFEEDPKSLNLTAQVFKNLYQGFPFDEANFENSLMDFLKDLKQAGLLCKTENKPIDFRALQMKIKNENQIILYHLLRGELGSKRNRAPLEKHMRISKEERALFFQHAKPEFLEAILGKDIAKQIFQKEKEIKEANLPSLKQEDFKQILERSGKSAAAVQEILSYFEFGKPKKDYQIIETGEEKYHHIILKSELKLESKNQKQSQI